MKALLLILVVNVLQTSVNAVRPTECGPEGNRGYDFFGINWDYNSDFPDGDHEPKFDGTEMNSTVSCYYYTELPKGTKVSDTLSIAYEVGFPDSHTDIYKLKGTWVYQRICGERAYITVFKAANDQQAHDYLKVRCQQGKDKLGFSYFGAEAYIAHPIKFEMDECPDVLFGGYVEVKENDNTQRSIIYKEKDTTGRIRMFDLESNVCLDRKTGKPFDQQLVQALYRGVRWQYSDKHNAQFQQLEHYKFGGDGGISNVFGQTQDEQLQNLHSTTVAYCIYFSKEGSSFLYTVNAKVVSETNKYLERGRVDGDWKSKPICNGDAYFWYFVPRAKPDFTCGNYMACNHQSDLDHVEVRAMQPGLTFVYGIERGNDVTLYGSFLEIFNNKSKFGVIARRSLFYADLIGGGIINLKIMERKLCI